MRGYYTLQDAISLFEGTFRHESLAFCTTWRRNTVKTLLCFSTVTALTLRAPQTLRHRMRKKIKNQARRFGPAARTSLAEPPIESLNQLRDLALQFEATQFLKSNC